MATRFLWWVSLASVLTVGCARDRHAARDFYEIEIIPRGSSLQRTLTCWHKESGPDGELRLLNEKALKRLEELYGGRQLGTADTKQTFVGTFEGEIPPDVGGAGSYEHWTTPLGSVSVYMERGSGQTDPQSVLAKQREAADELTDLLLGWFERELSADPRFGKLRDFVDRQFRRDLKNTALYAWCSEFLCQHEEDFDQKEEIGKDFQVRVVQQFCELGYFRLEEMPALSEQMPALFGWGMRSQPDLTPLQRVVARKMGVPDDEPIPDSLGFLGDADRLSASWVKYFRGTGTYRQWLPKWRKQQGDDAKQEPSSRDLRIMASSLAIAPFVAGLESNEFVYATTVSIKLHCGDEPTETNGTWDAEAETVTWRYNVEGVLPQICHAAWAEANEDAQRKHFGKVILESDELVNYIFWYDSLSVERQERWDELIAACRPGPDLVKTVQAFKADEETAPPPDDVTAWRPHWSARGKDMILRTFDTEEPPTDDDPPPEEEKR